MKTTAEIFDKQFTKGELLTKENITYQQVIAQHDRFDMVFAPELKIRVMDYFATKPKIPLLIDLSKVSYIDSSGLSAMLVTNRIHKNYGLNCYFYIPDKSSIMRLIKVSGCDTIFNIAHNLELFTNNK